MNVLHGAFDTMQHGKRPPGTMLLEGDTTMTARATRPGDVNPALEGDESCRDGNAHGERAVSS